MVKPFLIMDPGHGGKDPGGGTNKYWLEKDLVLKISLYQYNRYKELGVPVAITRTTDKYLSPEERTRIVRNSGAKYCHSNHINAGGGDGAEVIHSIYDKTKMADIIAAEIKAVGQNVRRVFTRTLSGNNNADYYFMIRDTGNVITNIIEYGFADSPKDDIEQLINNWQEYAEAVVKAFCEFAGYKYKKEDDLTVSQAKGIQKQIDEMKKQLNNKMDKPSNTNTPHDWAKGNWKEVTEAGYFDGTKPLDHITRQETAVVVNRLRKVFVKLIEENASDIENLEAKLCEIEKIVK